MSRKNTLIKSHWDGNYYAKHSDWQIWIAKLALNSMQFPKTSNILDIGCGDGRLTAYLAELVSEGKIVGLDPSTSMLAAAQIHHKPNLSFILGNATCLPYKNQFDRIVAFNSLHWVLETDIALKEIRKALKPDGQALILVAPVQPRHQFHKIVDKIAKEKEWHHYFDETKKSIFPFLTVAEWAGFIEEADLIPENLKLIDASMRYPNQSVFSESLASWLPFGKIPKEKRMAFVKQIVELYLANTPCGPDGEVYYLLDELAIIVSKS